jgi:hypothetical protein
MNNDDDDDEQEPPMFASLHEFCVWAGWDAEHEARVERNMELSLLQPHASPTLH